MKTKSPKKLKKEPPPPLLQKRHRNDIFEAIKEVGLDPREFDLKDSGAEVRIKHKWSEFASYREARVRLLRWAIRGGRRSCLAVQSLWVAKSDATSECVA